VDLNQYTLLQVSNPARDVTEGTPRKYKCSRGHKWELPYKLVGVSIDFPGLTDGIEEYCMHCLYESIRTLGRVKLDE
jgi:hypothetical protein